MYWKILAIVLILTMTLSFFLTQKISTNLGETLGETLNKKIHTEDNVISSAINSMISTNRVKKIHVDIPIEKFMEIDIPEGKTLYYFPEECPSYSDDIFLITKIDGLDRYFVPEHKTLIFIHSEHTWSKPPGSLIMWKK